MEGRCYYVQMIMDKISCLWNFRRIFGTGLFCCCCCQSSKLVWFPNSTSDLNAFALKDCTVRMHALLAGFLRVNTKSNKLMNLVQCLHSQNLFWVACIYRIQCLLTFLFQIICSAIAVKWYINHCIDENHRVFLFGLPFTINDLQLDAFIV